MKKHFKSATGKPLIKLTSEKDPEPAHVKEHHIRPFHRKQNLIDTRRGMFGRRHSEKDAIQAEIEL